MEYTIREIQKQEYPLLDNFLYEAIFIPEGIEPPLKSIISSPELQIYVSLSVQKANYATKMYLKIGFEIVKENEEEYIMVYYL